MYYFPNVLCHYSKNNGFDKRGCCGETSYVTRAYDTVPLCKKCYHLHRNSAHHQSSGKLERFKYKLWQMYFNRRIQKNAC